MVIGSALVLIIGLFPSRGSLIVGVNQNIGVRQKVLAYLTPPPKDLLDPYDEQSFNFTTVEKV